MARLRYKLQPAACAAGLLAFVALITTGCGDDKSAADSTASADTTAAAATPAAVSNAKQPAKVIAETSGFDQQMKSVPPADGAKASAVKPPAPSSAKQGSSGSSGKGPATVKDLTAFGNALIAAKANPHVSITTNRGTFVVEVQPAGVPTGAGNFVALAANHFYDKLTFHRVEPGFVIQGGDPQGSGMGGPGYSIPDEDGPLIHDTGAVAWAKSGPNTAGSQFYVTLAPAPSLDHQYTVFGKIVKGMDVVQATQIGDVMKKVVVTGLPAGIKVPNPVKK